MVPGITVSGHSLYTMNRVTGECERYRPRDIEFQPSVSPLIEASGTIEMDDERILRAYVETEWGQAEDGSLGPTRNVVFAEDVYYGEECPL